MAGMYAITFCAIIIPPHYTLTIHCLMTSMTDNQVMSSAIHKEDDTHTVANAHRSAPRSVYTLQGPRHVSCSQEASYTRPAPCWRDALTVHVIQSHNETSCSPVLSATTTYKHGWYNFYLILPGLSNDGRFVYQTAFSPKTRTSMESFDALLYEQPEWWDATVKKSTEWYLTDCAASNFVRLTSSSLR